MAAANLYEPPPPSYQAAQASNNHFAGKVYSEWLIDFFFFCFHFRNNDVCITSSSTL
jgi:hypothetical protein